MAKSTILVNRMELFRQKKNLISIPLAIGNYHELIWELANYILFSWFIYNMIHTKEY